MVYFCVSKLILINVANTNNPKLKFSPGTKRISIKVLFSLAFSLGFSQISYGQYWHTDYWNPIDPGNFSVEAFRVAPLYNESYLYKTGYAIHFCQQTGEINTRLKFGVCFGWNRFKATEDTFFTYAIGHDGMGKRLISTSVEEVHSVNMLPFGVYTELRILKTKFSPTVGLSLNYEYVYSPQDEQNMFITTQGAADDLDDIDFTPYVGFNYNLNEKMVLFGTVRDRISLTSPPGSFRWLKTGFGIRWFYDVD